MKRTIKNAIISKHQKEKSKRLKERQHDKKKRENKSERLKTRLYYIYFLIVSDVLLNR
jgi:hypothetical protein